MSDSRFALENHRERNAVTEEERELMERYGVTAAQETVYLSNGAKCSDPKNALNYAKLCTERDSLALD